MQSKLFDRSLRCLTSIHSFIATRSPVHNSLHFVELELANLTTTNCKIGMKKKNKFWINSILSQNRIGEIKVTNRRFISIGIQADLSVRCDSYFRFATSLFGFRFYFGFRRRQKH